MDWAQFSGKWTQASSTARRALHLLTTILCCPRSQPNGHRQGAFQHENLPAPTHRLVPQLFHVPQEQTHTAPSNGRHSRGRAIATHLPAQDNYDGAHGQQPPPTVDTTPRRIYHPNRQRPAAPETTTAPSRQRTPCTPSPDRMRQPTHQHMPTHSAFRCALHNNLARLAQNKRNT